jgi:hypothetical protein
MQAVTTATERAANPTHPVKEQGERDTGMESGLKMKAKRSRATGTTTGSATGITAPTGKRSVTATGRRSETNNLLEVATPPHPAETDRGIEMRAREARVAEMWRGGVRATGADTVTGRSAMSD